MDRWKKATLLVSSCFLVFMNCSNPVDKDPLKWRSSTEVPVTNDKYIIGKELPGVLVNKSNMDILGEDKKFYNDPDSLVKDTTKGDTIMFSQMRRDTSTFETHQDTVGEKWFHTTFGSTQISGAPDEIDTVPLPGASGAFSIPVPITLDKVYYIKFNDTLPGSLQIKLSNLSSVSIDNLSINVGNVGSDSVGSIAAGSSATAQIPVQGKSVGHTISVTLAGSAGVGNKNIALEFSVNNLYMDSAYVDDHLVNFHKEMINKYELTDTVAIDYIDILEGFFNYSLDNQSDIPLKVRAEHLNLWNLSGNDNITNLAKLATFTDSSLYTGWDSVPGKQRAKMIVNAHSYQFFNPKPLLNQRLFTEWDPGLKKTITKIKYQIDNDTHHGDTIRISANDEINFSVQPKPFRFLEFLGTSMEPYVRQSDTQKIAVDLPFGNFAKDSLKGKLILQSVKGDVHVAPGMPDRAFIDTMAMDFIAFPSDSIQIKDSMSTNFLHLKNDTFYVRSLDFTKITNCFPDTICITSVIRVPKGTKMRVRNDLSVSDPKYNSFMGKMAVQTITRYRLDGKFDWAVQAPVIVDLGKTHKPMPDALKYFRKMDNKLATFTLNLKNKSNLNLYLYALAAPEQLMGKLDSMSDRQITDLIFEKNGTAEQIGMVNLLGPKGVRIPPRDSSRRDTVILNDKQLSTILYSDSCDWRWQVMFQKQDRDALIDTDYIEIHSRMRIDGTNNTDSLLIWK